MACVCTHRIWQRLSHVQGSKELLLHVCVATCGDTCTLTFTLFTHAQLMHLLGSSWSRAVVAA